MSNRYNDLQKHLDSLPVTYDILDHEPCGTSEESAKARFEAGAPKDTIGAKALVVTVSGGGNPKRTALIVLPGEARLDSKAAAKALQGKRLSFVSREDIPNITGGLYAGVIPPFSAPFLPGVSELLVDSSLHNWEYIGFNAAVPNKSFVMKTLDYFAAIKSIAIISSVTN